MLYEYVLHTHSHTFTVRPIADLVPREVAESWLKYLREELPAVAFKCSTQKQTTNLGRKSQSTISDSSIHSECLGADTLLQLLKNYARGATGIKSSITVGVVGLPNVGKSSLINSLKRTRVAHVGNQPGVTKSVQEIHLDKQVTLLDSPGVVFATAGAEGVAAAALHNCVRIEQLDDPVLPVSEIVRRCPRKLLMALFKVPSFNNVDEFLGHVATARGKLKKGGAVDVASAARIVLQDWNDGRIPYYTMPPKRDTEIAGTSVVVTNWGADFDAQEVFAAESTAVIGELPSIDGGAGGGISYFEMESAGKLDVEQLDTIEEDEEEEEDMSGSDVESDEDEMDEGDGPMMTRGGKEGKKAQNVQLYGEKGQFNPHAARAERKRRKRGGKGKEIEEEDDDQYDFEADWDDAKEKTIFAALDDEEEDDME